MSAWALAERLRATREYVCLDLGGAAAAAGIAVEELAALERGERAADELTLERLARAYGYGRGYFLREPDPLDDAGIAVVARLGEFMTEHDRGEALLFAACLRDAVDD